MGSIPGCKVRIVARIRADLKKDGDTFDGISVSKPWISVLRPDPVTNTNSRPSRVKISFGSDQSSSGKQQNCEVDECYEQGVGNEEIFSKEIKPLITGLLGGQNSTVFAYGPQGSGKTYTIQGCEEVLGLAVLTVDAIFPQTEEQGNIITVSVFEVYQDRVSDLLDAKRPEVAVFEDAQGKIRLKGLSKVRVNSTSEFQRLYLQAANSRKQLQKATDLPHRSHIGCIIHVVSPQTENSNAQLVGKINFIDLAGYEDSRRKSSDGSNLTEATRINKSLYAVHNVLYALNAKEARVPYRESKLTRMLQDSLGGTSRILMVTCMNPSLCQETVQTISLASRSCMAGFLACLDPGKSSRTTTVTKTISTSSPQVMKSASKLNIRSSMMSPKVVEAMSASASGKKQVAPKLHKTLGVSSPQVMKSASKFNIRSSMMSPKVVKPMSVSASGKKQAGSKSHMSMKKPKDVAIEEERRKLFDDTNLSKKSELGNIGPKSPLIMDSSTQREVDIHTLEHFLQITHSPSKAGPNSSTQTEAQLTLRAMDMYATQFLFPEEKSTSSLNDSSQPPSGKDVLPVTNLTPPTFLSEDKENKSSLLESEASSSPPLSVKIRELSDNLKALSFSTEEKFEFKTPIAAKANENCELDNLASSQETPIAESKMHGSGMKDVLVQTYLKFLNTATKEELKGLKGIAEKRATLILEMREDSPEPFKQLDDLREVGFSAKQIMKMKKNMDAGLL